jgi:hypothetical protein
LLTVKTGFWSECQLVQSHVTPRALILTGVQTAEDLDRIVPKECRGIISVGLCGGLRPIAPHVGDVVVAHELVGPNKRRYRANYTWCARLCAAAKAKSVLWYSSGQFNQANTGAQREDLYVETGAWVIDDETLHVADFATSRNIPWAAMRAVSDAFGDDVSICSKMLTADGNIDAWEVLKGWITSPMALIDIYTKYKTSLASLESALINCGQDLRFI